VSPTWAAAAQRWCFRGRRCSVRGIDAACKRKHSQRLSSSQRPGQKLPAAALGVGFVASPRVAGETMNHHSGSERCHCSCAMTGRGAASSIKDVIGDLAPLCDQHYAPMRRSIGTQLTLQGCTGDQLCQRRYHPLIGYYAGLFTRKTAELYCATHFHSVLYVYAYDANHRLRQYACPIPGCEYISEWLPASPAV